MQYSASLPPLPRYIRRSELRQVVPIGDTAVNEMERRNEFPRRIVLMPRVVVWSLAEVEAWIEQRRRDTESGKAKAAKVVRRKRQRPTASASR
ncbi:MAG: AlpA family phage regulatory protein [Hyphomonadaceae bacterium]|nr:AlpA family phage regulatory protein [Hyphomonadaceae bacterium]